MGFTYFTAPKIFHQFFLWIYLELAFCKYWTTAWKVSKYGVCCGPHFPVFELNTEIYGVNIHIQSKYRKIRTRNNSIFGHFSSSGYNDEVFNFSASFVLSLEFELNVLFQKKSKQGVWRYTFLKKLPGVFRFVTLPLEIPEKISCHPWKFCQIVRHPLEIPSSKTKTHRNSTWVFL